MILSVEISSMTADVISVMQGHNMSKRKTEDTRVKQNCFSMI